LFIKLKAKEHLGDGSYGMVISAYDNKLKKDVAIKKLN